MISLKKFIQAIHDAILHSHDSLTKSSVGVVEEFFKKIEVKRESGKEGGEAEDRESIVTTLVPKTVVMRFPSQDKDGNVTTAEVHVPLITLVPMSVARIERAKLSADFELTCTGEELQLTFSRPLKAGGDNSSPKSNLLEITVAPEDPPEGLKLVIEGYEASLKRQMP